MDKLNIKKINELLETQNKTQSAFSSHISLDTSSLSQALNGKRPFPFAYIFKIASFFELDNPKVLIESVTEDKNNCKQHKKEKVL